MLLQYMVCCDLSGTKWGGVGRRKNLAGCIGECHVGMIEKILKLVHCKSNALGAQQLTVLLEHRAAWAGDSNEICGGGKSEENCSQ